ncbi:MAG TPA: peptidoglycan-binding protein [Hyphomonas sp.]|nr:peptidoglycan-binding protein [Hyphomonas sp.]|tara:strand:- start:14712 stop:15650 length:939 start_codon:yes stop_codon:yes gene_type:complete
MQLKPMIATAAGLLMMGPALAENTTGTCHAPVLIPETFETVTEQVLHEPERTEIRIYPAEYKTVSRLVEVKQAATEYRIVPAVYEAVTEQVLVRPERTETVVIPAEYETYTEQVLVRQAYSTLDLKDEVAGREIAGEDEASIAFQNDVLVSVEVPAEYKTITRTRIVKPEQSETRIVPAEYHTLVKQVLVEPARVEPVTIPAEYETLMIEQLVKPAREEIVSIPARYRTVEKRIVTGEGRAEWKTVLCDEDISPETITALQKALSQVGHAVEIDGKFGTATMSALKEHQREQGLGVGQLSFETLEALGVPAH